jgi:uncharacterized membrane protein
MNSDRRPVGNMLDLRIILAVLWVAGMLSSLNGDTYRLHDSVELKAYLDNASSIKITPDLLLIMSIIFVVPILMSVLTLILKYHLSRLANRIVGILYALIILGFWVVGLVLRSPVYQMVWATAQLVFALLVVWYAWKWPKQEA